MDRGRRTVKLYGLIYFQCKDGFLAASGLEGERLFLRAPAVVGETADEVLPFFGFADACVFRVVPTLSSQAAAMSVRSASGAARTHARGGAAAGSGTTGAGGEGAAAGDAYFAYDPRSTADIIDVEEITYGKSFSLVHEASGLFLSVATALPSENDPDCLSVVLVKPSAAQSPSCELSLVSRYKIHADGDKLCRADSVLIRLAGHPMFLHVSAPPIMEAVANNVGDTELLHRTFRLGSSLPFTQKGQSGPAGNGAGATPGSVSAAATTAAAAAAAAAAASAAEGAGATGMVPAPSSLSLGGSFSLPKSAAAAMVAPQRCSTDVAVEALTREYLDEVNACEEGGVTFTLHRYDVGTDRANRQRAQLRLTRPYVACGVPVALFHRERESFLMTSATQTSDDGTASSAAAAVAVSAPAHGSGGVAGVGAEGGPGGPASRMPSTRRPAAAADALDVDSEEGLGSLAVSSRQPGASLAGVKAATGASGAIRRTAAAAAAAGGVSGGSVAAGTGAAAASGSTAAAAGSQGSFEASPTAAGSPMENVSLVSYATAMQLREQQHRERALRTDGLIDTGDGRRFPFPVFAATGGDTAGAGHRGGNRRGGGAAMVAAGADQSTAEAHSHCTTLWAFEHEEPSLGGPVRLGGAWRYRLRHVVSGMYVAVCGSAVDAMLADFSDGDRASSKDGSEIDCAAPAPVATAAAVAAPPAPRAPTSPTASSGASSPVTYASSTTSSSFTADRRTAQDVTAAATTTSAPGAGATAAEPEQIGVSLAAAAAAAAATAHATRETRLCLIPSPRTRQELAASLFSVEPMYATDSVYLIEQSCLALRNVLTEMYVVTASEVDGSDVALSLDWQPSTADPVIASYVPHQLQLDARFVAGQCAWLARFRAEMQALVRAQQHARSAVEAAAARGDAGAASRLAAERAYLDGLPAQLKPLYKVADPDVELLQRRERALGGQTSMLASPSSAASPRGRDWTAPLGATYHSLYNSSSASHGNHGGGLGGSFVKCAGHVPAADSAAAAAGGGGGGAVPAGEHAVSGVRSGAETAPPYAAMRHTIRLCQRALIALLTFCTESDESNVLRREGLPISSRQGLFHEMRFHRLLFDVVQAPFVLLDAVGGGSSDVYRAAAANNIAALMRSDTGTFDEVFDQLRLAQQQQADMSCVWSGMWHSSGSSSGGGGGCDAYKEFLLDPHGGSRSAAHRSGASGGAPFEGIMDEKEIMLPMHRELHLLLRLALRLLRQLIKDGAATYARGWSAYIPALLRLDGLRLHVVDTMQELFTDNPHIPVRAVRQVSEHFIHVAREIRRGAYMDFLGAACTIKYRGVPERQAFVCQKLLVENPQSLCRFVVVVPPGKSAATDGVVYILPNEKADVGTDSESEGGGGCGRSGAASHRASAWGGTPTTDAAGDRSRPSSSPPPPCGTLSAPPPGYVPFTEFFRSWKDKKQVAFVQNQIALFARLCYDGCPDECRRVVQQLFPAAAMQSVLESFVWTGEQVVGRRCANDELRSHLIRLATQCFVLPRIAVPAVQLRVSTVLFGSSQLRQRDSPTYSGLPDDSMTGALKTVVKALLRANPFFVQDDIGRSVLMRSAVSMWLKLTRYRQYSHAEALEVLPLLMQLLDGTRDVVDGRVLQQQQQRSSGARSQPSSASSVSSGEDYSGGLGGATWISSGGGAVDGAGGGSSGWGTESRSDGGSGRRGKARLVHKEESVHLMRVREMVCQALFLVLQHEVFRAADSVIVALHDAYTAKSHGGTGADGHGEGRGVLRGVLSAAAAVRVPLTAPLDAVRSGIAAAAQRVGAGGTETTPLLPPQGPLSPGPRARTSPVSAGGAERNKRTALAARRRADGYAELHSDDDDDGVHEAGVVQLGSLDLPSPHQAVSASSAVYSTSWTSQHLGDDVDSPFAALSSSDSSSDSEAEVAEKASAVRGVKGRSVPPPPQRSASPGLGRSRRQRGAVAGVSAAEVQACLDYHTSCIAAYFTPARLVPCLFDLTRYDCSPLTVQAMNLLVQLCVVKRSIAQLVLKVNTLPSVEVLRGFDKVYDVAVQLREAQECTAAAMAAPAERSAQWETAVTAALHALRGPSPAAAESPGGRDGDVPADAADAAAPAEHADRTRRTAHLRQMYDSMRGGSVEELLAASFADEEDDGEGEASDAGDAPGPGPGPEAHGRSDAPPAAAAVASASFAAAGASANASMAEVRGVGEEDVAALSESQRRRRRQQRVSALWSKTSGAVRMLVYNTTICNRRRAMGLSETSTIPLNTIIRAEMMAHWKVHESVLAMLPSLDPSSETFRSALQFFYLFTFSESNALLLQPYVALFLDKLYPNDASATVCLHVVVRILRCVTNVEDFLTQPLLEALVGHVKDELFTKLPDPELVNMLSQYIFSKSSVSPVVRRRMMILFREHGTLSNLSRVRINPTLSEVLFMSALVNLICGICGSHTSVLTLARSMLPAEQICGVILQKRIVQSLPSALMEVSYSAQRATESLELSATPHSVAALKLLNPYIRLLVALYFIPKNDSDDDSRRRCLLWMGNAQFWGIAKLFTQALNTVSDAMERDGAGGGGSGVSARVVNRGVAAVRVYRTLLCSTIPVAVAAYFMNCFSNEAYVRFQKEVIGRVFTDLSASCARFGALLMQHAGALGLTVEEVVNHSRALGTLKYRLQRLDDPDPAANLAKIVDLCEATKQRMRVWLATQQRDLELAVLQADAGSGAEAPASATAAHAAAAAHALARRLRAGGRLHDNEDDMGAFRLLFAEEAVSTAQLRSQEALEAAGLSVTQSGGRGGGGAAAEADGADMNGLNSVGLLLPGVLSSDRGVTAVRASLRSTLRGDTIVPSLRRGPSETAMIATRHLLRCAGDEAMREAISCVLEAMREHLFRPRTFVGVLNLFANALDATLHYPQLVSALATTASTSSGGGANAAAAAASVDAGLLLSYSSPTFDGDSASWYNPDAAVPLESLGYAMQTAFNDAGMLNVVISLCGLEEDVISLNAIRLGVLMLEGGNRHAQSRLLSFFVTREESFFYNVRDILRKNLTWVEKTNAEHQFYLMKRGMHAGQSKSAVAASNIQLVTALNPPQHASAFASAVDANLEVFSASRSYVAALHGSGGSSQRWRATVASGAAQVSGWARVRGSRRLKLITLLFRLLQLFCEGHYAGLQNYIRAQHDNLHSANIIHEAMVFMEEVSTFVTPSNFRVILQGFEFLTEVCQGPCRLNQQSLIDYGACRVVRHVVEYLQDQSVDQFTVATAPATATPRAHTGSRTSTSSTTNNAEAAMELGGGDVMNALHVGDADRLRVSVSNTLLALLEGCREADAYRRVLRQIPLTTVALEVQYALHPSTLHYIVHDEDQFEENDRVAAMFNWMIYLWSVQPYAAMEGVDAGVAALLRSSESVSRYLGSIEIRRADGLERVYFRVPIICTSLTQERKNEVLWTVDRTSRATKLADFLHKSDELIFAVEWNHAFHRKLRAWTRYTVPYVDETARGRLGLVHRSVRAFKVFHNNFVAAALLPYELSRYDTVSMVLAVLTNTILIAMEGGSGGSATAGSRRARAEGVEQTYGNATVSVLCVLQTVVCAFLCIVYIAVLFPVRLYSVYKNKQRVGATKLRMNVELAEAYAGLTARERLRTFMTWFDMQFRLLLFVFAVLSCTVSHYFAAFNLMLVVYSIPTLRTFIAAITMNGRQLLLTSFMGVIMLYLFSIVGFLLFPNQYNADGGDGDGDAAAMTNCETLLRCFAYILDQGLRAGGGVGDVMQPWAWGTPRMMLRLAYDMLFYALVTVVFLNILFGIIIDTFGQMRDEKREKEADMHGLCFICGLDADTLEKGSSKGFANHVKAEHNMWMYLNFMHHLRRKDPSDYTGQESYVNAYIRRGSLAFFPEGDCVSLMEQQEENAAAAQAAAALGEEEEEGWNAEANPDATASATAANARAAMKELTLARETVNAYVKEWQGDLLRLKAVLQQLELTSRGVGAGAMTTDAGACDGRTDRTRHTSNSADKGGGTAATASRSGGVGGRGERGRNGAQTWHRSARAETRNPHSTHYTAPPSSSAEEYALPPSAAGAAGHAMSADGGGGGAGHTSGGGGGGGAYRALQTQLDAERQLRQRAEAERQRLQELLRDKEAALRRASQSS